MEQGHGRTKHSIGKGMIMPLEEGGVLAAKDKLLSEMTPLMSMSSGCRHHDARSATRGGGGFGRPTHFYLPSINQEGKQCTKKEKELAGL